MHWQVKRVSLLERPADALIVPANPFLNLSGGVGADLVRCFERGSDIQRELHAFLRKHGVRHVPPGTVVATSSGATPYRVILHAVALDGFYDTSPTLVAQTLRTALLLAAKRVCRTVAMAAVATGYGRMSLFEFAASIRPLLAESWPPIEEIVLCIPNELKYDEFCAELPELRADAGEG